MHRFAVLLWLLTQTAHLSAQNNSPADSIIKQAYKQATQENKKVLVIFHASWCTWCHKLDSSIKDSLIQNIFNRNFIVTHLSVFESVAKKNLETPGALDLYKNYSGGKAVSIPFWVIVDNKGKLLADCRLENGENVGCPATVQEVKHLLEVLRVTSDITSNEQKLVEIVFRRNDQ